MKNQKKDLLKEKTTKIVKFGKKEISVSNMKYHTWRFYDRYTNTDITLYIHKEYKSNIYYLVYSDIVIMVDKNIKSLLKRFDEYISKIDGLDNKVRFIRNIINNQ